MGPSLVERKVFSLPQCCFQVTGRNVGVGTTPGKDSGLGESLDLSPPVPKPTPVPSASQSQVPTRSVELQGSWSDPNLDLPVLGVLVPSAAG